MSLEVLPFQLQCRMETVGRALGYCQASVSAEEMLNGGGGEATPTTFSTPLQLVHLLSTKHRTSVWIHGVLLHKGTASIVNIYFSSTVGLDEHLLTIVSLPRDSSVRAHTLVKTHRYHLNRTNGLLAWCAGFGWG